MHATSTVVITVRSSVRRLLIYELSLAVLLAVACAKMTVMSAVSEKIYNSHSAMQMITGRCPGLLQDGTTFGERYFFTVGKQATCPSSFLVMLLRMLLRR